MLKQLISTPICFSVEPDALHVVNQSYQPLTINGTDLNIDAVVDVARHRRTVRLSEDPAIVSRIKASSDFIRDAANAGRPIYGVTTGFGGMANVVVDSKDAHELQRNIVWYHKTGTGRRLPTEFVRAAMLLRANTLLHGASGVRLEIVNRFTEMLNYHITPHVYEHGSIGASGDLVPLSYIAGALIGIDRCYTVDIDGEESDAVSALERFGLPPLTLGPKEGLALINGTSVMTGIAAVCMQDMRSLTSLALAAHALMLQGLYGTNQSFHEFIHAHKPHRGQVWCASHMLQLLHGSKIMRDELDGQHEYRGKELIQDRYSLRCLAQYLGPVMEGLATVSSYVDVEANSATDNPLIDVDNQATYHGGNFLGQYIGIGMDHLRYYIGLIAKHLDVQIALLVSPEFNSGLPASLVGNTKRKVNMGLKGLQLSGNSVMPLLTFYGNSLADRFPTHAEQFNQNLNSQGFGSAVLAAQSVDLLRQYVAMALIFAVQSVDLRTYQRHGHYDASRVLSPATAALYQAVRDVVGTPITATKPYIWDDDDQALDLHMIAINNDLKQGRLISDAIRPLTDALTQFCNER